MSIIAATLLLVTVRPDASRDQPAPPAAQSETEAAGAAAARRWIDLVDAGRLTESWDDAAAGFRAATTADAWADAVQAARGPLGALRSRGFDAAQRLGTLPGLPDGDYSVVRFRSSFANKRDAAETVYLVREGADWKVAGYFIR